MDDVKATFNGQNQPTSRTAIDTQQWIKSIKRILTMTWSQINATDWVWARMSSKWRREKKTMQSKSRQLSKEISPLQSQIAFYKEKIWDQSPLRWAIQAQTKTSSLARISIRPQKTPPNTTSVCLEPDPKTLSTCPSRSLMFQNQQSSPKSHPLTSHLPTHISLIELTSSTSRRNSQAKWTRSRKTSTGRTGYKVLMGEQH